MVAHFVHSMRNQQHCTKEGETLQGPNEKKFAAWLSPNCHREKKQSCLLTNGAIKTRCEAVCPSVVGVEYHDSVMTPWDQNPEVSSRDQQGYRCSIHSYSTI